MAKGIRGLTSQQELDTQSVWRDTRPFVTKFRDGLYKPGNAAAVVAGIHAAGFAFSGAGEFVLPVSAGLTWWALRRPEYVPIKLPIQSRMDDPNQPHPKTGDPTPAKGIFYLGNETDSGKEVWLTNDDARQHFLVLGTTGAGKALPLDTPVHTPLGWRQQGDLQVGDLVSTPDGNFAEILGVYPQGTVPMRRLTFSDGRQLTACTEHLWKVFLQGSREAIISTEEIERHFRMGNPIDIPFPEPMEQPEAEVLVEPYLAGRHLVQIANRGDCCATTKINLESYEKGSIAQRMDVLFGIMDQARLEPDERGLVQLSLGDNDTAQKVASIVRSIGGWAFVKDDKIGFRQEDLTGQCGPHLSLKAVEVVAPQQASCIYINHPDHLYIAGDYVVTHNTETLIGFAANALSWGSGFLFCDGKGDVSLFAKIYTLARLYGREDDLLVLNFMTGNTDVGLAGGKLLSNTVNPFSSGSSDNLTQMVVGLMDDVGGDGAMWKGRATAMLSGVLRALTFLRNEGVVDLNVGEIRDHLNLRRIIDLSQRDDLPDNIRKTITSYLTSLPGYNPEKGYKQSQTTLDQHGYLEMQFTKILGSLADVYGHIFHTPAGEVDMHDVVLNRRILVVMLPALEKSGDEIANIGKIIVASLKGMMGGTLGSQLEGSWDSVVENRPTNSPSPFMTILDEVGYYTVEGMALMAAQARSLGFSMVYSSQDIPAMLRLNDKEAQSIIANTNTKIIMRTEEPEKTAKLAIDLGDEAKIMRSSGFEKGQGSGSYHDNKQATVETAKRVSVLDLKAQGEGEMHILYKDNVVRAKSFYANPQAALDVNKLKLRANHFIKIAKPSQDALEAQQNLPRIIETISDPANAKKMAAAEKQAMSEMRQGIREMHEIPSAAFVMEKAGKRKSLTDAACIAVANAARGGRASAAALMQEVEKVVASKQNSRPSDEGFTNDAEEGAEDDTLDALQNSDPMDNNGNGEEDLELLDSIRTSVRGDVGHSVSVDEEGQDPRTVDTTEKAASSEMLADAMSGLSFEGDEDPGQIETEYDKGFAREGEVGGHPDPVSKEGVVKSASEFEASTRSGDSSDDDSRSGEGDALDQSGESQELLDKFVEQLINPDDED